MISVGIVENNLSSLQSSISNYQSIISSLASNWQGDSYNNLASQSANFVGQFQSAVVNQLESLITAINSYNKWLDAKKNYVSNQSMYNSMLSEDNQSSANYYLSQMKACEIQINTYSTEVKNALSNITGVSLTANEFVYFNQNDYANYSYGGGTTIKSSGCGPTAMAMVLTYLTGEIHDPVEMAQYSLNNGYRVYNSGTAWSFFGSVADTYGISCTQSGVSQSAIYGALEQGKPVIMAVGPWHFTNGGHFIVLKELTSDGKIIVADPNRSENNNVAWDVSVFLNEGTQMWVFDE